MPHYTEADNSSFAPDSVKKLAKKYHFVGKEVSGPLKVKS